MRLSEREKKYVLILVILLLIAALYYFFTAAVEPFLQQKAEIELELATLEQQAMLQQTKIKQLDKINEELKIKTDEAIVAVAPFYPALPQDGLLLQVQALLLQSGLVSANIGYSGTMVAEPGIPTQTQVPLSYHMKTLADLAMGKPVAEPPNTEAPVVVTAGQYALPQTVFTLDFTGTHAQVQAFIQAVEALDRTVTVSSLNETKGEAGEMMGTLTVTFLAVEKPAEDTAFAWTLPASIVKTDLFSQQYAEPVTVTATGETTPAVP